MIPIVKDRKAKAERKAAGKPSVSHAVSTILREAGVIPTTRKAKAKRKGKAKRKKGKPKHVHVEAGSTVPSAKPRARHTRFSEEGTTHGVTTPG